MTSHNRFCPIVECFMEDLVECFEEFVKKSMTVVCVAVGTLLLTVVYVVKLMAEHATSTLIPSTRIIAGRAGAGTRIPIAGITAVRAATGRLIPNTGNPQYTGAQSDDDLMMDPKAMYTLNTDQGGQVSLKSSTESTNPSKFANSVVDCVTSKNGNRTIYSQVIPNTYSNNNDFVKETKLYTMSNPNGTNESKQVQVCNELKEARHDSEYVPCNHSYVSNDYQSDCHRCSRLRAKLNSCCSMCCEGGNLISGYDD